ncbi:TetR/AcrR family transcriptional regulator [soil metagenome]
MRMRTSEGRGPVPLVSMGTPDTRQQILDATFGALADIGLARLSLEEVASRAGVSRQTLYRHFGNRPSLIQATIVREEERLLQVVTAAAGPHEGIEAALTAALTALLQWTAEHPLLGKLLASEPESLLPLLAAGDAPVIAAARPAIVAVLAQRLPPQVDVSTASDLLARLMLSYAIDPPEGPPSRVAAALSSLLVHGLA